MAIDRFYIPGLDLPALEGDEARHCTQVLRHGPGDRVVLFDGKGGEMMVEITGTDRDCVKFKCLNKSATPKLGWHLSLIQAVPKGKNMDLIIQKATELGASAIYPVMSSRTVVQVDQDRATTKNDKWHTTIIEACKQCGQNWVPELHPAKPVADFLNAPPNADLMLVGSLQPGAKSIKTAVASFHAEHGRAPRSAAILIGPEGDFTPAEISRAIGAGFLPITLGRIILRCETAAIYCMSVLAHELQTD